MEVTLRDLASIRPYHRNPRRYESAVPLVAQSIRQFGFRQPIVIDSAGVIICGHARYFAAKQIGLAKVPVHVAADLTPEQVKAYRIADNKAAEASTWDKDLLPLELGDLERGGIDLESLGFSIEELMGIMPSESGKMTGDPDQVVEAPDDPVTRPGDLWILGDHRLLCGDSAKAADLDRLLEGVPVHLVHTDPPYNVAVAPRSNNATGRKPTSAKLRAKDRPLKNDFVTDAEFQKLLRAWFWNLARVLEPGRAFYCWGGYTNIANYPAAMRLAGLYFSQAIIWVKQHPVMTRKDFMGDHEWCFYGWREGCEHKYFGPANATDVWTVKKVPSQDMVHLTQKPIELACRAMEYSSRPRENVLDLFGGSGSTLIAAEQLGRRAYLVELDPLYCDVIVRRWERLTGKPAERVAPGGELPGQT